MEDTAPHLPSARMCEPSCAPTRAADHGTRTPWASTTSSTVRSVNSVSWDGRRPTGRYRFVTGAEALASPIRGRLTRQWTMWTRMHPASRTARTHQPLIDLRGNPVGPARCIQGHRKSGLRNAMSFGGGGVTQDRAGDRYGGRLAAHLVGRPRRHRTRSFWTDHYSRSHERCPAH